MSTEIGALAAQNIIADLAQRGGGTYDRAMRPFTPTVGYAVGVGGFSLDAAGITAEQVEFASRVTGEFEESLFGTWAEGGKVYFDAVRYFGSTERAAAIACGVEHEQAAIYDFAARAAINLTGGVQ